MRFAAIFILCIQTAAAQQAAPPAAEESASGRLIPAFAGNPPRIELTDSCGKTIVSRPLLKEATYPAPLGAAGVSAISVLRRRTNSIAPVHITSPDGTVVYVLQTAPKFARVSAFDLTSGAAGGEVDVPPSVRQLRFNSDGSRLLAYGSGDLFLSAKAKEQHTAAVTVIDRTSMKAAFSGTFGQFANTMRYVPQIDRMLVLDSARTRLWFIDPAASTSPAPISLGGIADGIAISRDGSQLLTLVRNTNKSGKREVRGGSINLFDIASGKLLHTSEKMGDALQLVRFGDDDEYWVMLKGRMQRVSREGEPLKSVISFQKEDKELGRGLGGLPGPALFFGKTLAIEIVKPDGSLAHEVALIDTEAGHVDSVAAIGRPGVRGRKTATRWAIAIGLSAAAGAAGGGAMAGAHPLTTIQVPVFLPGNASRVSFMAVGARNRTLYVMDAESDDVTAVKQDGTVAEIIPIKSGGFSRLWTSPESPYVYHFGQKTITVIGEDNTIAKQIPIGKGFSVITTPTGDQFYLCNKDSCEIWSAVTAAGIRTVDRRRLGAALAKADEAPDGLAPADDEAGDDADRTQPCSDASQSKP